ncbi:MAG: DUF418 domain-containing protein [Planctomycetales bacterium]|nr:DUF418 domain-containing protein [Planctomycetales bacterium]
MTLTNYIMQSVFGVLVFYGCGLGYWGYFGVAWSIPLIGVLFTVQSLLSAWWLQYFQNGPLEWVWRCMTYGRWLPWRRQ